MRKSGLFSSRFFGYFREGLSIQRSFPTTICRDSEIPPTGESGFGDPSYKELNASMRRSQHDYPSRYCWHRWDFTGAPENLHGSRAVFEIVAVCDIIKSKANEAAEQWGVPKKHVFSSYNKMLEMDEIDTVSVCTYNQGHRRPTVAALNAGKHVFCEKPMAATLPDATAMVRAAKGIRQKSCRSVSTAHSIRDSNSLRRSSMKDCSAIFTIPSPRGADDAGTLGVRSSTKRRRVPVRL